MANQNLLIIGAGGHGKELAEASQKTGKWKKIAFLDDRYPSIVTNSIWPVIGKTSAITNLKNEYHSAVVGIGNNELRLLFLEKLKKLNYTLPIIKDPSAIVSEFSIIHEGTVIFPGSIINIDVHIGMGAIINTGAIIAHDCDLRDGVHICPNASLAGAVHVGKLSWIGIGSSVIEKIHIGENVIVGAGSVVIRNVADNTNVAGVPAKLINK